MTQPRALRVHLYDRERAASLVRFALASQIEQHGRQHRAGRVVGLTPQTMSRLVRGDFTRELLGPMSPSELRHLGAVQDVLARDDRPHASLVAFHGRLFPDQRSDVSIPARWADVLVRYEPRSLVEVLLQGEATLAAVSRDARRAPKNIDAVLDALIHAGSLPAREGIECLQLVARFADPGPTRQLVFERLRDHLERSPMGFRAWRAVSLIVRRHEKRGDPEALAGVERETKRLFDAELPNAHPSRSLDIEAAAATPPEWEWANGILAGEADRTETTPRRLAYAALARWERELTGGASDPRVLDPFVARAQRECGDSDHYAWVLANLVEVQGGGAVGDLPATGVFDNVARIVRRRVAEDPGLSDRLEAPVRYLILHGLLSPHGLSRRLALDTLRTGWLAPLAADVIHELIDTVPAWVAGLGTFAIGFMGERSSSAEATLRRVLAFDADDFDTLGAVEAAAWSVGELWPSEDGTGEPAWVVPALRHVVDNCNYESAEEARIGRAVTYSIAVMAPREGRDVLSRALDGPDELAHGFALLGLGRYHDGATLPLVKMRMPPPRRGHR